MNKDRTQRPDQDPIRSPGGHEHRAAPGKVTLTSKLSPGRSGPAQRKASATAGPASPAMRPTSRLDMDSLMDVAHRGLSALSESSAGAAGASPSVSTAGQPMPDAVQAKMDRAFGTDLSAVRVHQGPQARAMGALAYTQGSDIHFAPGQYDPSSQRGQELLGHELTHVVQQAEGRVQATTQSKGDTGPGINDDAALEREADVMGARAARGEAVGSQATAPGAPGRDASAPVQRMIDKGAPVATTWTEIQPYLYSTLINARKQTFAEAVEEFIVTKAEHFDQVQSRWETLAREAVRQGKVEDALRAIQEIIQIINSTKIAEPDHPNKPESVPADEQYGTIPQSDQSKSIAGDLRDELLAELYGAKHVEAAKTYDGNRIQGAWKKDFMLGVLILPDGTVHVSHSGFMGPTQNAAFTQIVTAHGYQVATHDDNATYTALQDKYKNHLKHHIAMPPHHQVKDEVKAGGGRGGRGRGGRGRGRGGGGRTTTHVFHYDDADTNVIEKGNPLGLCAAPQGLHTVDTLTAGGDFPAQLEGATPMALTEVLVRDDARNGVTVKGKSGHDHEYKGNQDVPSCLSCQVQLRLITKLLTDRRRNVVNRQNIRGRNGDDITQAVELLKGVLHEARQAQLVERILSKDGGAVDDVDADLGKLEDAEKAYRKALDESAKELTAHPELVESGNAHPGIQKDVHKAQRTALAEKRLVTGSMMKPGAYNDAMEEAATAQQPFTPRNQDPEPQAREEAEILARAEHHFDNLFRYRIQESLTEEQATHYGKALMVYRDASEALAHADRGADTGSLNDQVRAAIPLLRQTVEALEADLQSGPVRREERREEWAQLALRTPPSARDQVPPLDVREDEDELRRAAEASATSSRERQEQRAEEEARRLEALAFGIAQAYGTSIERALRLLTDGGANGPYTPERDESKTEHMYG